jgi:hypothetical protein
VDLTVPYKAPATITGTVAVTGLPAGTTVQQLSVLLCPSFSPYNGTTPSMACVDGYPTTDLAGATSATYEVSGLPPVQWTVYPSYCTQYGCETNAHDGKTVTLGAGQTSTVNVTASFVVPADGMLSATINLTGAPTGTSDTVAWTACPQSGSTTSRQTFYVSPGIAEGILLPSGSWTVTAYYLASPFDNAVPGPTRTVTVSGGRTTNVSLSIPYRVPGTAAGSIDVLGVPAGVSITSYTVVACPASAPLVVNSPSLECASEYSGPAGYGFGAADRNEKTSDAVDSRAPAGFAGAATAPYNVYGITSLTPGCSTRGMRPISVRTCRARARRSPWWRGAWSRAPSTWSNQKLSVGAVTGQVVVLDAPANGFQSGAQACTALPTSTSCPGRTGGLQRAGRYLRARSAARHLVGLGLRRGVRFRIGEPVDVGTPRGHGRRRFDYHPELRGAGDLIDPAPVILGCSKGFFRMHC